LKNLRVLFKFFVQYKWHFLLGIVFVAASNYFRAWQPQVIREALDHVFDQVKLYQASDIAGKESILNEIGPSLLYFGGIVVLLALIMGVFMYLMRQTIIVMSRLIEYDMRKEIFDHYQRLDLSFYRKNNTGDLMARISEDVSKVRMFLGPAVLYGINLTTLFIMVIYSMFKVNVELTLYTLLPLPILSLSIYYVSSIVHRKSTVIQTQLSQLNSAAQEVYSGIRVVKSYVQGPRFVSFFDNESQDYKTKSMELARVNAMFFPLMLVLIGVSTIIVIYVGGLQVARGEITTGNIAEFVIYVNMLTWPVTAIGWIASIIQQADASQERINEFMHTAPLINSGALSPSKLNGDIEFKDVSFTYSDTGIEAIQRLSFKIQSGDKIAIVGKTASGKTTIADLITRMFDVSNGQILIDGRDIRTYDLATLRKRIGYVPQDVFLFSDSVANNVRFGTPEASLEKVYEFTKYSAIYEELNSLPEGFETRVGERGVTLSGGQKQRISIARAFIKDPDIVILDDALSAVDTKTEQKILGYLNNALSNRTAIIITHRIYSSLDFDKILVLESGTIIEQGTHDQLIDHGGVYYDLFQQQSLQDQEIEL
jgi:ATP-binding cassette subfamily B protein